MQPKNITAGRVRNSKGHPETILHPDPILAAERLSLDIVARFYTKIEQTETCWLWVGAVSEKGHGRIGRGRRKTGNISVTRLSWLIHNGELDSKVYLQSACPNNNPMCVHPNHFRFCWYRGLSDVRPPYVHRPLSVEQFQRVQTLCDLAGIALNEILENHRPKHKTPEWMIEEGFSETFADRFWRRVEKTETCWIWTGARTEQGYGWIGKGRRSPNISTHRASWMMANGPIPKGLHILHNCPGGDNPSCVNPAHLRPGTLTENHDDAVKKQFAKHGVHWNSRLTLTQVNELRERFARGGISKYALAKQFGISGSHVRQIILGLRHPGPTFINPERCP